MTGANSPFPQAVLDHAVALIVEAGPSRQWAEDYLAQSWASNGIHPTSAAEMLLKALWSFNADPTARLDAPEVQ
jgi:hypothetical protein